MDICLLLKEGKRNKINKIHNCPDFDAYEKCPVVYL